MARIKGLSMAGAAVVLAVGALALGVIPAQSDADGSSMGAASVADRLTVALNVRGVVVARNGDPVKGAQVCLQWQVQQAPCAKSGADGSFVLSDDGLYPGVYQVIAISPDTGCGTRSLVRATSPEGTNLWDILFLNNDGIVTGSDLKKSDGYATLNFTGVNVLNR
jgi:hypothetical protein